jgi:hypothetical protein
VPLSLLIKPRTSSGSGHPLFPAVADEASQLIETGIPRLGNLFGAGENGIRVLSRCVLEFDGAVSGRDESTGSGSQVNRPFSKVLV